MSRHPVLLLVVIIFTANLVACYGPGTTRGKLNRDNARARVDTFNSQLAYDQAIQAFRTGQFKKAMRQIDGALKLTPDVPEFYILMGRVFMETHLLEQANDAFDKAIELNPNSADAHYYLGIVYQRWSNDQSAYEYYARAHELDNSTVQFVLAAAESLIALSKFDEAQLFIESKMDYFEHNASMRQLLGQIALLMGNAADAAQIFAEARLLNPDDEMLLEELAHAQYVAGLYGKCYDSVKQFQRMKNGLTLESKQLEARCLVALGRTTEARNLYLELTRSDPSNTELWIEFGSLAWEIGDYRKTALCSVRIVALAPHRYEGYMLKGIYEREKGNLNQAASLLRQSAALSSDVALPHMVLGRTLEENGDVKGALGAYADALRAEPDNEAAQQLFQGLSYAPSLSILPGRQ